MNVYPLYVFPNCPYSQRVVGYLVMNVDNWAQRILLKDAHKPEVEAELLALGGKLQVPCLDVDGFALYESTEIIRYFEDEKALGGTVLDGGAACAL